MIISYKQCGKKSFTLMTWLSMDCCGSKSGIVDEKKNGMKWKSCVNEMKANINDVLKADVPFLTNACHCLIWFSKSPFQTLLQKQRCL